MRQPAILALLRPHQWVKNAFVAAPLFFTPSAHSPEVWFAVALGFASFCLVSSGVYVLNDISDREADAKHPTKRLRPIAAGRVTMPRAWLVMALLLAGGLALAWWLSSSFTALAGVYLALNVAYSLGIKNFSILDVMTIALGFVLRVQAGAVLIGVPPSSWILIAAGLLALFLALAKRRDDVVRSLDDSHRKSLNGYSRPFLDNAVSVVLGALLVAYLIYTTDEAVMTRLGTDKLFYTAPFVVAGILRYLQIAIVEERSGSPTTIVLSDRFLILSILGWLATFAALIYG